ncbi:hypothetical protein Tco_1190237, partial [Tanacetum coccineum]
LAASEVFGADTGPDEDTGSVVAWSPLVIISHLTDVERFRMIKSSSRSESLHKL